MLKCEDCIVEMSSSTRAHTTCMGDRLSLTSTGVFGRADTDGGSSPASDSIAGLHYLVHPPSYGILIMPYHLSSEFTL